MTKLLLVEDDKNLREIYTQRLKAEGYDIISAGDGEEALALAIKERPDLIVSDVMMPKISGFDMLDILRSTTETKDIKVIMMTALSSEDQRARGEQLGANKYLVKSQVGIEDVVRAVHEVLGDAPVTTPQNAFAPPAPSAVPAAPPTTSVSPTPTPAPAEPPTPEPVASVAPVSAQPVASPAAVPATPPAEPAQPAVPTATPTPAAVSAPEPFSLPQPTAPFSTDRPAGLADRIIQPLDRPTDPNEPLADRMDKELSDEPSASPFATSPAPEPDMSVADPVPSPQAPPAVEPHGIEFEETPLAADAPPANGEQNPPVAPTPPPAA